MRMGKKSILFGVHCPVHSILVLWGWLKINGWRRLSVKKIIAIIMHDYGYYYCDNIDGADGKMHPLLSALIVREHIGYFPGLFDLVVGHSSHMVKLGIVDSLSPLYIPDKWATAACPSWLWAVLAHMSGEGYEYMDTYGHHYGLFPRTITGLYRFHKCIKDYYREVGHYGRNIKTGRGL